MSCAYVLVVDDDDDVRESIGEVLVLDGHRVVSVENGEQAIGAMAVAVPRAVVTDLSMPIRGGHELVHHIRSDARTRDVPICVVSAEHGGAPEGTLALRKPFELQDLRAAVRAVLSGRAAGAKAC